MYDSILALAVSRYWKLTLDTGTLTVSALDCCGRNVNVVDEFCEGMRKHRWVLRVHQLRTAAAALGAHCIGVVCRGF